MQKGYGFINWDISKCQNISSKDICSLDNINYFSCLDGIMFCKKSLNQECIECIDEFTIYNNNTKECIEIKYEYNNSLNYYTPDNGKHFYKCDFLIVLLVIILMIIIIIILVKSKYLIVLLVKVKKFAQDAKKILLF